MLNPLARVHTIFAEWRFAIAGEKVVAGSKYKTEAVLESSLEVPVEPRDCMTVI